LSEQLFRVLSVDDRHIMPQLHYDRCRLLTLRLVHYCILATIHEHDIGNLQHESAEWRSVLISARRHCYRAILCIARTMLLQDVRPSVRLSVCLSVTRRYSV